MRISCKDFDPNLSYRVLAARASFSTKFFDDLPALSSALLVFSYLALSLYHFFRSWTNLKHGTAGISSRPLIVLMLEIMSVFAAEADNNELIFRWERGAGNR